MRHAVAILFAITVAACAGSPEQVTMRLNGSSVASFERSYAAMLESLPAPAKARLTLAMERIATLNMNGKIVRAPVEALRWVLNNKSFVDLLRMADEPQHDFKVGWITEPSNNAFERPRGQ